FADITWATSDLRTWLNNTFYNKAFNDSEKDAIKKETISTSGSVDTEDNVFLLSTDEANTLFSGNSDRVAYPTVYAKNVKINNQYVNVYDGSCGYWLRTNTDLGYANYVVSDGSIAENYVRDTNAWCTVRPAIYLDVLSSYCTANESNLTYNLDGGEWIKSDTMWRETNKYKEGQVTTLPSGSSIVKDGYILKGWSINGSTLPEMVIKASYTGNLTLKAMWVAEGSRDLTDRENAAFIVRDEWTSWVKSFTNELSELDKNATSRIYSNMDFYDMQYRFTEKYKKVPEYLDEDGKPTEKLKNLIKEKRKEIAGASNKIKDYLKFTSNQNGSTVKYVVNGTVNAEIGYSKDGSTFTKWNANENITLDANEYIYVYNRKDTLSRDYANYLTFAMTGSIAASGNAMSMLNFIDEVPSYGFRELFSGCSALTKAPELPATKIGELSYSYMFYGCSNLKEAPDLPAKIVLALSYEEMFSNCTSLERGPYIKGTNLRQEALAYMFNNCTSLNYIKLDYAYDINHTCFGNWVSGVTATGTLYYNGPTTTHGVNEIPINFTVETFTD
ncbi:MAG: InlB B-repeat-containing protein, partial [Lachnospiraceae bacterium]|nr:InlB B-repeat-containing protein [Lachnospiraceae bacterium]